MPGAWPLTSSQISPALARADWVFRNAGKVTIALLLTTLALLVVDADYWVSTFLLAHLAALVALLPLGVVLVRHAFARAAAEGDPGPGGVMSRYRDVVVVLLLIAIAVTVTLVNFEDGIRWLRRVANFVTVGLVLFLVVRYMRWMRRLRGVSPDRPRRVI